MMSSQDSNRLYSWLWDSHISPKNSKWLPENLADIDATVKQMIKIIEEDGDSFAKRAEMYYKRRPELMRLVEQFYRAYRGLAERYSHATGVIRQAHHTMVKAFPDQVPPLLLTDECQADCKSTRVVNVAECLFGFGEKDVILGFGEEVLECGGEGKSVGNTSVLKDEKEDGLVRFEIILGRISSLESRATCAEEESRRLKEQANRARVEVQLLNDALRRSEVEKENALVHYEQCVERISFLESELSQSSGDQIRELKDALASAEAEKETILAQHSKCATMISSLQTKLINAEDETRRISERADMAEEEAEWLKKEIAKLEEEKEVASLVYWLSIEKISTLEKEFSSTQVDVLQLKGEINAATLTLQGAETRYLLLERFKDRLQSEMESVQQDIECQRQRLLEKQTEFGKVWTRVQDEVRFVTSQLRSKEELVEKCELRNESLENEIAKMNKVMENFIEQNLSSELSMEYLKSENEELRAKILKLDEEVEVSVNLRNELQNEKKTFLEKMSRMEKVIEENAMMRKSLFDLNCALDESYAEPAFGCSYAPEEARVEIIVHKVEELKEKLRQTLDDNELLGVEKSVLVMLFGQLRQETAEAAKEKKTLLENLKTESRKLTVLENEVENLLKMNDMLGEKINERSDYVEKLENDIRLLNVKFSDVQDSYRKLRIKDAKVLQENMSLRKEFLELKHKNRILEDENCTVLVEALSLRNTSLVFKSFVTEKTVEVEELEKTTQRLERDREMLQAENMHLARAVLNGKDLFREKESQLHLAEENLEDIKREKARLEENFEVTKRDFSKARETQDAQLLKLLSDNSREIANNTFLHKMMKQLDTELAVLQEQCEETEARGMPLSAELEIVKSEIKELFSKLLISSVREAVFSEKANELSEICRSMEKERIVESEEVKVLREKVHGLEGENSAQNASLDALVAAVESLRSSFLSLEGRTRRVLESAEESEESELDSDGTGDHNAALFRGLAKVQDLQNRMKALEHLIGDIGTLQTSENLATEIKCEVPMYEDLRHGCGDLNINSQQSDVGIRKVPPEASFVESETPKDITLDKASKLEHHGSSRTDDRMLELWEIGSEGQSIDLTVSKGHKAGNSVSEIIAEDEGLEIVDKLEISKRFIDSYQEENKRKMLQKLESDGLKLTNLQITIQDLMIKVSITEKTKKKDHDIEYDTVKEQLEEAEEAVTKLSEMNSKLKKAIQDNDLKSLNGKSQSELEHAWNSRRRKILDHANRGAERLTRLQLEVQKLQFLLLKLDNEQEKKPKTQITDSGPKFLLKDYLHGRVRSVRLSGVNQSKKKILCGCILPPTKGDSPRYMKN